MKFKELHNDKETNDEYLLNTVKESLLPKQYKSRRHYLCTDESYF